jgi:hypothetical protein
MGIFLIYVASPAAQNFDSFLSLPTAVAILHHHTLHLDAFRTATVQGNYGLTRTADGHEVDSFPWTPALLLIPATALLDLTHTLGLTRSAPELVAANHTDLVQEVSGSAVAALTALVVFAAAHRRFYGHNHQRAKAGLVTFAFAFGTANWSTASRAMWSHGPAMLALATAWLAAVRLADHGTCSGRGVLVVIGVSLAVAYTARPTSVVTAAALLAWVGRTRGIRTAALVLLSAATVLAPWLVVNRVELGNWLPGYDAADRLSLHSRYAEALTANVVSPSRGLLVASPVVVVALLAFVPAVRRKLSRESRSLDTAMLASVALQLGVVSALGSHWWAGHAYGARFMSDALPALALLSCHGLEALDGPKPRAAATGLLLWSMAFASQGAIARATICWNTSPANIDSKPGRIWSVTDAQALRPAKELAEGSSLRHVVFGHCGAPPSPPSSGG